eukprot:scaffold265015_cov33-Attheya_sp.AAC.4
MSVGGGLHDGHWLCKDHGYGWSCLFENPSRNNRKSLSHGSGTPGTHQCHYHGRTLISSISIIIHEQVTHAQSIVFVWRRKEDARGNHYQISWVEQ